MTATLRAFLVNSSRALGVEPQHLNDSAADDDVQTALLQDVIALREAGDADLSLRLLEAAEEAGLVSDWIEDNRARALLALKRTDEAVDLLKVLCHCETEAVAVAAREHLKNLNTNQSDDHSDSQQQSTQLTSEDPIDSATSPEISQSERKQNFDFSAPNFEKFFENLQDFAIECNIEIDFIHDKDDDSEQAAGEKLLHQILVKAISLRNDGLVDHSFKLLQIALDSGFQSGWILDNQVRSLLLKGDIEAAREVLNKLSPASNDDALLSAKKQLEAETKKLSMLFEDYAQPHLLREAYFKLKNTSGLKRIKAPRTTLFKCLELAAEMRESYRIDESLLLLLILAKEKGYDPWIEDNIARLYAELEDWKSSLCHWLNILDKSNDLNAVKIAADQARVIKNGNVLKRQAIIEDFGHLLFEEHSLNQQIKGDHGFDIDDLSRRFWLHDSTTDSLLTKEINQKMWEDFRCKDLRYAARYLLRNKIFHGRSFMESINQDGGIAFEKIVERCRPFFDDDFYFRQRDDLDSNVVNGLEHYCLHGWKEGSDPNPTFSSTTYLEKNPTLKALQINPLYHYACHTETTSPHFLASEDQISEFILQVGTGQSLTRTTHQLYDLASVAQKFPDTNYYDVSKLWLNASSIGNYSSLKIHFVIPDFSKGGGGHMTIFRMIRHLEEKGHSITVWVVNPNRGHHAADMRDDVIKYFQPIKAKILPFDTSFYFASGDCLIATGWQTVEYVKSSISFREKYYFIQDYEPFFYARGTQAVLAEQTYKEDLACICASPWLDQLVKTRFGRWSRYLWLAYDHTIYGTTKENILNKYNQPDNLQTTLHIAVYARSHTERRCVELALNALDKLSEINNNFIAHFFGDEGLQVNPSYQSINYGILNHEQLNVLYKKCTIGLTFSATNYSLLPQEMMASGLPVFDLKVESTEAIYPEDVITLMEPNADAIAQVLNACLRDPSALADQAINALDWVEQFSWERAGNDFEQALIEKLDQSPDNLLQTKYDIERISGPASTTGSDQLCAFKASVVIPVFNGGPLLASVLDALSKQQTSWKFQCIIIDSGSSDDSLQICLDKQKDLPDLSIYKIPKGTFQHGFTRNIGVEISDAEFVAFITQDAIPANEKWLYSLVNALEANPNAAGAFGRHIAHDDADPYVTQELLNHFKGFQDLPVSLSLRTDEPLIQNDDQGWRKILHFYSDNNSCLRKDVWKELPLPCVPYGEDQMWADIIIRNSFEKIFVNEAVVKHSHDYSPAETFERSLTEAEFFASCFGYKFHPDKSLAYIGISKDLYHAFDEGNRLKCTDLEKKARFANIYAKHLGWLEGYRAFQKN